MYTFAYMYIHVPLNLVCLVITAYKKDNFF